MRDGAKVQIEAGDTLIHARFAGELGGIECQPACNKVKESIKPGVRGLVIDLSSVTYIGSYFIGSLLRLAQMCSDVGCTPVLVSQNPHFNRVLSLVGVSARLERYTTVEEARAALGGGQQTPS